MSKPFPTAFATAYSLCLPFPMRQNFMAQIIVPIDMTKKEADRLCAFVMTLAQKGESNG